MTKRKVPNVVRGGIAIPIKGKTNYYYMLGRKHTDGGIDIGKNPKTGIEVEDGEIMHITNNGARVFSAVPFLNGESPAQKVMRGENANEIFNEQERFKKVNNIKDDGSRKKQMGGDEYEINPITGRKVKKIKYSKPNIDLTIYERKINNNSFWDKIDNYANIAEKALGLANLTTSIATAVVPNPASATASYITGLGGGIIDGYQLVRDITQGNTTSALKNLGEIGLSAIGLRSINTAKKLNRLDKIKEANKLPREYVSKYVGRGRGKTKVHWTKEKDAALTNEGIGYGALIGSNALQMAPEYKRNNKKNNAAYNLEPYHKDLNDSIYIEKNYNFNNRKLMGGNNRELNSNNGLFYSITDKGKTKHYMIPSTGNSSARSAEVRTKKLLGGTEKYEWFKNLNPAFHNIKNVIDKDVIDIKNNIYPETIAPIPFYPRIKNVNNWWSDNKNNIISDGIGLVSNIAGSLISHSMNKNMLNRLKPAPQPIARQAAKLKTQININPQLDKMRETVSAYERNIDNNTNSSNVALARKQNARLANILNANELYGTKENIETELINKDRLNQQAVSEKNVTDYNKWLTDVANFRNTVIEQKANNDVSLINNLNAGIQNMLAVKDKRKAENQTIAAMALANPNLPIEMFFEQGLINRKLYDAYKKAYPKENV